MKKDFSRVTWTYPKTEEERKKLKNKEIYLIKVRSRVDIAEWVEDSLYFTGNIGNYVADTEGLKVIELYDVLRMISMFTRTLADHKEADKIFGDTDIQEWVLFGLATKKLYEITNEGRIAEYVSEQK